MVTQRPRDRIKYEAFLVLMPTKFYPNVNFRGTEDSSTILPFLMTYILADAEPFSARARIKVKKICSQPFKYHVNYDMSWQFPH